MFGLSVNETSDILRAPYGWVIARRCAVEKVTTRHILIRYAGARDAGDDVTRTQDEARALAEEIRSEVTGGSFEATARERSEDSSAERGGRLGAVGRGMFQPAYEEAAFALDVGEISAVVETEYGYHVIERLPDES